MEQFRPVHVVRHDAELATALRDGDAAAAGALYEDHGAVVHAIASVATRDGERAADITEAVFVHAWHHGGEVEPGDDFAPWLAQIARQLIDADAAGVAAEELVWAVRAAVDSLDDSRREVLRLRHVDGLDRDAIARRVGIDPVDVDAHVERGERRVEHRVDSVASRDGAVVAALLADPLLWSDPPPDLAERIGAAIAATNVGDEESGSATAARSPGGLAGLLAGRTWIRPALVGAATAVVALFAGVVVLSALSGTPERETTSVELTPTGAIADVGGTVQVTTFDSGLEIVLDAPTLPMRIDATFYQAWVGTADGELVPVGTFRRGDRITMWAGVERDRVDSFVITLEAPAPGDDIGQASSDDVVLRASL